ncbi:hypothetical protein [Embleya sp. NPDC005971]|uniref:hypothetical protein n=1 Tax=Embleya sp. NPDC005971 TaxID=3156724 RepID=UPI00340CE741
MSYGLAMWLGGTALGFAIGTLLCLGIGAIVNRIHTKPPQPAPPLLPEVVTRAEAILREAAGKGGVQG